MTIIPDTSNAVESFVYPGGEIQVRLAPHLTERIKENPESVAVLSRARTPDQLIRLKLLADAIVGVRGYAPLLSIPYLPYSRADRRFVTGDCHGLNCLADILIGDFSQIYSLDIHNPRAVDYINDVSPKPYITRALNDIAKNTNANFINVVLPDSGALRRYSGMFEPYYGTNTHASALGSVLAAEKTRNQQTGEITGFTLAAEQLKPGPVLVVDDICDGGRTFLEVTKTLPPATPLYLYTTHGIYSKGLRDLLRVYTHLYTTDSIYERFYDPKVTVYENVAMEILPKGNRT